MERQLHELFFSAAGTTRTISDRICHTMVEKLSPPDPMEPEALWPRKTYDILRKARQEPVSLNLEDCLVVVMPVYSGRLAPLCVENLCKFTGAGTPAIAVVVYGNRAYEDALRELSDILREQGFVVAGAAAFIARHSLFPKLAEDRPSAQDFVDMDAFATRCAARVDIWKGGEEGLMVPGNRPYREYKVPPLKPSGNAECNGCGVCVRNCPVQAIPGKTPRKTNKEVCISCASCVVVCPQQARAFRGLLYTYAAWMFTRKYAAPKQVEMFF